MMLIFNLVLSAYNMFIQNLVLTKNNLTSLPDALFSSLKQLKIVDLSENILESIPGTIGQCGQMEILRIQDNNLADRSVSRHSKLKFSGRVVKQFPLA